MKKFFSYILLVLMGSQSCNMQNNQNDQEENLWSVEVYETSAAGNALTKLEKFETADSMHVVNINKEAKFQTITGFGGAFTESSAYLLNQLSDENSQKIIDAYFSEEGANYSLCRTHMNSCDFSLNQYSYAPIEDDKTLEHFSIEEDQADLIPMIKAAMASSKEGFKLFASPWTAPPWMKDNKDWVGGKLLPQYYDTWALFFSKYHQAYQKEGIDLWGYTVENEPHGNGDNWESMHYSPEEMTDFVQNHLGPQLEKDGFGQSVILGYDQNRAGIKEWVDVMYQDEQSAKYYDGTAIHWYESTYDYFPEELQYAHRKAPNKYLIQTEACVDSEIPAWKDDAWYWSKVATDWGWDWAREEDKHLHPKYVPVYRYARDIIGCLNNHVDGWVDWNMVLDRQGGPNWFKNWCVAPIIVDQEADEVYFTPIYYTMVHFSKFIRPGAEVLSIENTDEDLMITAAQNPDGSIAVVLFNPSEEKKDLMLKMEGFNYSIRINNKAIQTILLNPKSNE